MARLSPNQIIEVAGDVFAKSYGGVISGTIHVDS